MAQTLACQSDDGNAATFIGTNLDTGESVTLCPPCLLQFCGTIVEGMTGLPVNELLRDAPAVVEITDDDDELEGSHDPGIEHTPDGTEFTVADDDTEHSATQPK